MSLYTSINYTPPLKNYRDLTSESIVALLRDVGKNIHQVDDSFDQNNLRAILSVTESGEYQVETKIATVIDLSRAKMWVEAYRKGSEGGCQSCISLRRETVDAQDATSAWTCEVSDPDYNSEEIRSGVGAEYSGFSPKVEKHYQTPCKDWKPRFSPTIDQLVLEQTATLEK